MKQEFNRYRLGAQRVVVGMLQVVAGLGLLAGMSEPWMGRAAAGGLAMGLVFAARGRPPPEGLVFAHLSVAALGLILLLAATMGVRA